MRSLRELSPLRIRASRGHNYENPAGAQSTPNPLQHGKKLRETSGSSICSESTPAAIMSPRDKEFTSETFNYHFNPNNSEESNFSKR
jgi:hypothetical protein